jgi:hypothetical protein
MKMGTASVYYQARFFDGGPGMQPADRVLAQNIKAFNQLTISHLECILQLTILNAFRTSYAQLKAETG